MEYVKCDVKEWINVKRHPHLKNVSKVWITKDRLYLIFYDEIKEYKHLRITRCDDEPIHNYMDLFQIKNDLLGEDVQAIEVYPKLKDFVYGTSHTYHIWSWDGIETPNLMELYEYIN